MAHSGPLTRQQQRQSALLISASSILLCGAAAVLGPPSCPFSMVGCILEIVWQNAVDVRDNERGKGTACAEVWPLAAAAFEVQDMCMAES